MSSPTRGFLRGLRATSLGVVGFALALSAHLIAGGLVPRPVVLLLLAGLTGLAAALLTGIRLSPARLIATLIALQVVLHEAFMRLGSTGLSELTGSTGMTGMTGMTEMTGITGMTGMADAAIVAPSALQSGAMAGAHVAATVAMAMLLAHGERVLWFLAEHAGPPRWLWLGLPDLPATRAVPADTPEVVPVQFATGGVGLRAPPPRRLSAGTRLLPIS